MKWAIAFGALSLFALVFLFGCVGTKTTTETQVPSVPGMGISFPKTDVKGKDVVPRYPGSIRMSYEESEGDYYVDYYVTGNKVDDVASFYESKMVENGWNKSREETQGASVEMHVPGLEVSEISNGISYEFTNDKGETVTIDIGLVKIGGKEYTVIETQYFTAVQPEDEYASTQEVSVPDVAKPYNDMLKPLISDAVGGAKITKANAMQFYGFNNIVLGYMLRNPVNSSNQILNAVKDKLTSEGYTLSQSTAEYDYYDFTFVKGDYPNATTIEIKGNIGNDYLEVTITTPIS